MSDVPYFGIFTRVYYLLAHRLVDDHNRFARRRTRGALVHTIEFALVPEIASLLVPYKIGE
jgi:hypothetical protein